MGLIEWCTSGKELIVAQMVRLPGRDQKVMQSENAYKRDVYPYKRVW
mgnify:CR=1 FL=1